MSRVEVLKEAIEALPEKVDRDFKNCLEMLSDTFADFLLHFGVFPQMQAGMQFLDSLSFVSVQGEKIQSPGTMQVIVIKYADGPVRVVIAGQLTADQIHEIRLKARGIPYKIHTLCFADQNTLVFQAFKEAVHREE